jgi:hypothetical protein
MNITVVSVQVICPGHCCPVACRTSSPLDDLAARLRCEMSHGRNWDCGPMDLPGVTIEMVAAFRQHPERN